MTRRAAAVYLSVVAALVLLPAAAFGVDRLVHRGDVLRNVSAAGIDLSGRSGGDAARALDAYRDRLLETFAIEADGHTVTVDPEDLGASFDTDELLARALRVGRDGSLFEQFVDWSASWFTPVRLEAPVGYDPASIHRFLDEVDRIVDRPPRDGGVDLAGTIVIATMPRDGRVVERGAATAMLAALVQTPERTVVDLPLESAPPRVQPAAVAAAAATARELVDRPVRLIDGRGYGSVTLDPEMLAAAVKVAIVEHSPAAVEVSLDGDVLGESLASLTGPFTTDPVDSVPAFDEATATMTFSASIDGTTLDLARVADAVEAAAMGDRVAIAPIATGVPATWSTERVAAMEIGKVSEFTTYYACCQSRVTNIQLIADEMDGVAVWPGETFSVNDHVGRRTLAEGYRRAGAIIRGEVYCCDHPANVGGGTSQFATTLYNAVFFGCYEDVFHQPHSIYFSRYPRGREATLGYPAPDVIFRNDTDTLLWIDTSYTERSVTVTFYGNTNGRTCTEEIEGRNPITVTRVITHADGSQERESFTWTYRSTAS